MNMKEPPNESLEPIADKSALAHFFVICGEL